MASPPPPDFSKRALSAKLRKVLRQHYDVLDDMAKALGQPADLIQRGIDKENLSDAECTLLAQAILAPLGLKRIEDVFNFQVFISWDMVKLEGLTTTLQGAINTAPSGLKIEALLDLKDHAMIAVAVERGIRKSDLLFAFVDEPNCNVAFETGLAAGLGIEVRLVYRFKPAAPFWGDDLFPTVVHLDASRPSNILRIIARDDNSTLKVPAVVRTGKGTTLLCNPDLNGEAYIEAMKALCAGECTPTHLNERASQSYLNADETFSDCGRLIWVQVHDNSERDGPHEAQAAFFVGYAKASGIEVLSWAEKECRQRIDTRLVTHPLRDLEHFKDLFQRLGDARDPRAPLPVGPATGSATSRPPHEILKIFRRRLTKAYSNRRGGYPIDDMRLVVPILMEEMRELGSRAKGDRGLAHDIQLSEEEFKNRAPRTVLDLLHDRTAPRHIILRGQLGSGKSTTLCSAVWALAKEQSGPLAIMQPLAGWEKGNLFEQLEAHHADSVGHGLCEALKDLADGDSQNLILLFDGLDETGEDRTATWKRIEAFAEAHGNVRIVVTGRPTAFPEDEKFGDFKIFELKPLSEDDQIDLLCRFTGEDPDRTKAYHAQIAATPGLREPQIIGSPLFLRMLADIRRAKRALPRRLVDLYEESIEVLLEGKHHETPRPVKDVKSAEVILSVLALELHGYPQEQWRKGDLRDAFDALKIGTPAHPRDPAAADALQQRMAPWGHAIDGVLDDIRNSGLLAPSAEDFHPWSFYHRSFREYLGAKRLLALGPQGTSAWLPTPKGKSPTSAVGGTDAKSWPDAWAQVFAYLCAITKDRKQQEQFLDLLAEHAPTLLADALSNATALPLDTRFDRWKAATAKRSEIDGDTLVTILEVARIDITPGQTHPLVAWFSRQSKDKEWLSICAMVVYALDQVEETAAADALITAHLPAEPPRIDRIEIPAAVYSIGSPQDVGHENERPQHQVRLSSFSLGKTTVTEAQYRAMDPSRSLSPRQNGDLPVTGVSWWESYLFARWVGGFLPTEWQWEAACRAGTSTAYSFGDDPSELSAYGWFGENSDFDLHPVAKRKPNPWGLYDMHGNVWEWCRNRYGPYPSDVSRPHADPVGPSRGRVRVLRVGSYRDDADGCRSAWRNRNVPGSRFVYIGFRVAFPVPPALDP